MVNMLNEAEATCFAVQEVVRHTFQERCGAYLDLFAAAGRAHA